MLKIGELAKRAGLSVRTLHHYDDIGLLSPSARSDSSYRLYTQADVIRLHRIQILKQFGYSLPDIKQALNDKTVSPLDIITRQLLVLDEQERQAKALRSRLERLKTVMVTGAESEMADWLTILEMMTLVDRHFSSEQISTLEAIDKAAPTNLDKVRSVLVAMTRKAMDEGIAVDSEHAQELGRQWTQLLRDITANDAGLVIKLDEFQKLEKRVQEIYGITPELMNWVELASVHARASLFAKYVSPDELAQIRQRQLTHRHEWAPLFAAVYAQMDKGVRFDDPAVLELARRWEALFHASHAIEDKQFKAKIQTAYLHEPELMAIPGVGVSIIAFIERAIVCLHDAPTPESPAAPATPRPSVQIVAMGLAAHQLLDDPIVFHDPLALKILGSEDEAALRADLARYQHPAAVGLRSSVAVRSRVAHDQWAIAEAAGVRQYVILGAGLDTFAYRQRKTRSLRVFEVDLPSTQQWKRERLKAAAIAEPASLTYVPFDFEHMALDEALEQAGYRHDKPAFFSWLGTTFYLEEAVVWQTLRFLGSCAPGSGVVFDYCMRPELLSFLEQVILKMVTEGATEQGEPWKTVFDPAELAEILRTFGFRTTDSPAPETLNARYFAGRTDDLRAGGITPLMLATV